MKAGHQNPACAKVKQSEHEAAKPRERGEWQGSEIGRAFGGGLGDRVGPLSGKGGVMGKRVRAEVDQVIAYVRAQRDY